MKTIFAIVFYVTSLLAWLIGCTLMFIEITNTPGLHFLARYSHTTIWVVFVVSLVNSCYCLHNILWLSHNKQVPVEHKPTKSELLIKDMNKAIENEDYIEAARIRDILRKESVTESNN